MAETKLSLDLDVNYPKKFTKTYSDFSTAALTNSIELFSLPAGGVIHAVKIKHSTGFVAAAQTTYTLSVGITGTLTKYCPAYEVDATANPVASNTFAVANTLGSEDQASATSIKVTATSNVNLNTASAGVVDIWVWYTKAL